jgi:GntR family transcriptional regulator
MATRSGYLNRHSPVPLYHQLTERLRATIREGHVQPGDLLGTEKELSDRFGVSRATVRQALDALTREDLVVRVTGRGTFVGAPHLTVDLPNLISFTEEMQRRGIVAGSDLIQFRAIPCREDVARELGCDAGDEVLHIRRVRTGDGVPIVVGDHYLAPLLVFPSTEMRQSLYETIEERCGIELAEATHTIRAGLCLEEEAPLLDIAVGDAVLRFRRTTFATDGRVVLYESGAARADMYEYSIRLTRT